jgi:hypothetical protein
MSRGLTADIMHGDDDDSLWKTIRDDNDPDTKFIWWKNHGMLNPISNVRIEWNLSKTKPQDRRLTFDGVEQKSFLGAVQGTPRVSESGYFRIRYFGVHKGIRGSIQEHVGISNVFCIDCQ